LRRLTLGARLERTERPEEERSLNVFRTPRPHSDLSIIGRTRWDNISAVAAVALPEYRRVRVAPFVEVSTQRPRSLTSPAVFEPREFYGAGRLWSFSIGARVGIGMHHSRMGRYGVAVAPAPAAAMDMGHDMDHDMEMEN
jgi:hypothetical protein